MTDFLAFFAANGFAAELLICSAMFLWPLKKKPHFLWRAIASFAAIVGFSLLWNFCLSAYDYLVALKSLFVFLLFFVFGLWCFDDGYEQILFRLVGAYASQHLAFRGGSLAQMLIPDFGVWQQANLEYLLSDALIYALAFFAVGKKLKRDEHDHLDGPLVIILCFALLLFTTAFQAFVTTDDVKAYIIYSLYDFMCCGLTLWFVLYMYRSGRVLHDYQAMEHMLAMQKQQMETSRRNINLINIKCHDLKKMIGTLEGKIGPEEVNELNQAISIYDSSVKTGNEALDIVLTEKSLYCERHKIALNCIADGAKIGFMAPSDVYSLFGNALDNAVEAVMKLQDKEDRIISFIVKEAFGIVSIHIENHYEADLTFAEGLPLTTKSDGDFHGYGMKSIKAIAAKYGGEMTLAHSNGLFVLDIAIPLPTK
jgi:signal transduction histidine kinase